MVSRNFNISTPWKPTGSFRIIPGWFGLRVEIEEWRRLVKARDSRQIFNSEQFRYRKAGKKEINKLKIYDIAAPLLPSIRTIELV